MLAHGAACELSGSFWDGCLVYFYDLLPFGCHFDATNPVLDLV